MLSDFGLLVQNLVVWWSNVLVAYRKRLVAIVLLLLILIVSYRLVMIQANIRTKNIIVVREEHPSLLRPPAFSIVPVAGHRDDPDGVTASQPEDSKKALLFLDDIFISVKTTRKFHQARLVPIIKTWFTLAKKQVWFFSDSNDPEFEDLTKGHIINTNCSSSHDRRDLCCKMSVEYDTFLKTNQKWFCHFDDDNYVNVPQLVKVLNDYDPNDDWYLGKPSIKAPLEIQTHSDNGSEKISFWFATGGAGFCLSRALALKMQPIASNGKFIEIGDKIRLPDDVTMGYIVEHLLKKRMTIIDRFHSHLEPMRFLPKDTFRDQISFSYAISKRDWNVLKIDGFDLQSDPQRFPDPYFQKGFSQIKGSYRYIAICFHIFNFVRDELVTEHEYEFGFHTYDCDHDHYYFNRDLPNQIIVDYVRWGLSVPNNHNKLFYCNCSLRSAIKKIVKF